MSIATGAVAVAIVAEAEMAVSSINQVAQNYSQCSAFATETAAAAAALALAIATEEVAVGATAEVVDNIDNSSEAVALLVNSMNRPHIENEYAPIPRLIKRNDIPHFHAKNKKFVFLLNRIFRMCQEENIQK